MAHARNKRKSPIAKERDEDTTYIQRRKDIAGDKWANAEAGNLAGYLWLKGLLTDHQKDAAYDLWRSRQRYLASIKAPGVKVQTLGPLKERDNPYDDPDYVDFLESKYRHQLTVLQYCGIKVRKHVIRLIDEKESALSLVRIGLDALAQYPYKRNNHD